MRQMVLTTKKIKRDADKMKETIFLLDKEIEQLIKKRTENKI